MKKIISLAVALVTSVSTSWALPEVENHGKFISVAWKDVSEAHLHPENTQLRADEITFVFRKDDLISISSKVYPKGSKVDALCYIELFLKSSGENGKTPTRKYISLATKEEKDLIIEKIMQFSHE